MDIRTKTLVVTIEAFFKNPLLYKDARCDESAQRLLEVFPSYGLNSSQIALRCGDVLFNYDLSFTLFGGNGMIKLSAEKLEIHFQNVAGTKDFEVVSDCIVKAFENLHLPAISSTSIIGNAQVTAPSIEAVQQYLQKYGNPSKQIALGGTIAYTKNDNWSEVIRLMVDRSLIFPDGLYLQWSTTFSGGKMTREVLKVLGTACDEAASKLDLHFPKTETR